MSTEQQTIGERVAQLMAEQQPGKSVTRVAREAGVDFYTLRRTIDGETTPNSYTIEKFAEYFSVNVDWLYTGRGEQTSADDESVEAKLQRLSDELEALKREIAQRRS